MIRIITNTSRIVDGQSNVDDGVLIITPHDSFDFVDGSTSKKVTINPVQVSFASGQIVLSESAWSASTTYAIGDKVRKTETAEVYTSLQASNLNHALPNKVSDSWWTYNGMEGFDLVPTVNSSQDKVNLYFEVKIIPTNGKESIEYWTIDGAGPSPIEITDVTKIVPSPIASTETYVASDQTSVTSIANGIPRAGTDGIIDAGWIVGVAGGVLVYQFIGHPLPTPSAGVLLADGYDNVDDQTYVWAGGRWRVTGG